jgi:O-antigen ligase
MSQPAFLTWQFILVLSPAFILVIPGGHFAPPLFLSLVGWYVFFRHPQNNFLSDQKIKFSVLALIGAFWTYALLKIGLGIYHANGSSYYEKIIPFILYPSLIWLVIFLKPKLEFWLLSVAFGCLFAFIAAIYQINLLGFSRAYGASGNPIPFGNTAVVLSAITFMAAAAYPFSSFSFFKRSAFIFLGLCGIGASLLSGSKGGWISLFLVGITIAYVVTANKTFIQRYLAVILTLLSLVVLGMLAPSSLVKERIYSGYQGGKEWFRTGEVTDWSVSMRLEIWRLSVDIIKEKPLLGHGQAGIDQRWTDLVSNGQTGEYQSLSKLLKANPHFRTADNELLESLKSGGVVGALSIFILYFGVIVAFWPWRKHIDPTIRALATTGLLLVALYLEFGLSVSVLGINVFRSVFLSFAVILLGFIILKHQQSRAHFPLKL